MAGGIVLLFRGQFDIKLLGSTNQALHVKVTEQNRSWCLSDFGASGSTLSLLGRNLYTVELF